MTDTLAKLRDRINQKIIEQGENASCFAYILTPKEVYSLDEDGTAGVELTYPDDVVKKVLFDLSESDDVLECMDDLMNDYICVALLERRALSENH